MDFDDFDNGFDDGDFMDDDSFEDGFDNDFGSEDSLDDGPEIEEDSTENDMCDDEFTTKDAVILGGFMGWAYEEGLEDSRRKKVEKKVIKDKDNDQDDL